MKTIGTMGIALTFLSGSILANVYAGGDHAEQKRGRQGEAERESEAREVEADLVAARKVTKGTRGRPPDSRRRPGGAQSSPDGGQEQRFGQDLSYEAWAPGTQSVSDRILPAPRAPVHGV